MNMMVDYNNTYKHVQRCVGVDTVQHLHMIPPIPFVSVFTHPTARMGAIAQVRGRRPNPNVGF